MDDRLLWKNNYKIGNKIIDKEHEGFFEIANNLYTVQDIKSKEIQQQMIQMHLKNLLDYTTKHFLNEEKLMESINFPYINEHISIHNEIKKELNFFVFELYLYSIDEVITKMHTFINKYLIFHIKNEDTKIAKYLNNLSL